MERKGPYHMTVKLNYNKFTTDLLNSQFIVRVGAGHGVRRRHGDRGLSEPGQCLDQHLRAGGFCWALPAMSSKQMHGTHDDLEEASKQKS